jgi:hypothetical protein
MRDQLSDAIIEHQAPQQATKHRTQHVSLSTASRARTFLGPDFCYQPTARASSPIHSSSKHAMPEREGARLYAAQWLNPAAHSPAHSLLNCSITGEFGAGTSYSWRHFRPWTRQIYRHAPNKETADIVLSAFSLGLHHRLSFYFVYILSNSRPLFMLTRKSPDINYLPLRLLC